MSIQDNKGWVCPKCDRVYAPWVAQCTNCVGTLPQDNTWPETGTPPYIPWPSTSTRDIHYIPCLWDSMPETYPGSGIKQGCLSCPCPRCTPVC